MQTNKPRDGVFRISVFAPCQLFLRARAGRLGQQFSALRCAYACLFGQWELLLKCRAKLPKKQ
jgi:hypothetical protein